MKQKKLSLKKVTISSLDQVTMAKAFAGAGVSQKTRCPEDDNCYSFPWVCYTQPGYNTCGAQQSCPGGNCGGSGGGGDTNPSPTVP